MATAPKFLDRPASYILVWPGDEMIVPQYGGAQIAIPPITSVADPAVKGSVYRYPSVRGRDGKPIPGTVEIRSQIHPDPATGGVRTEFDAVEWAKGVYGNRRDLTERGFSVVETVEEIPEAMAAGRAKWEARQEAEWQRVLTDEHQRRARLRQEGKPITKSTSDARVRAAIAGLAALQEKHKAEMVSDDALANAIGIGPRPVQAPEPKPPVVTVEGEMAERLYALAEKHDINLTKDQLRGLLKREDAAIQSVSARLLEAGIDIGAEV